MADYTHGFTTTHDVTLDFINFLETDEFTRLRHDSNTHKMLFEGGPRFDVEIPGLFDIIELWLVFGNGGRLCPTFETFLLVVIDIIDGWGYVDAYQPRGKKADPSTIDAITLWPDAHGGILVGGATIRQLSTHRQDGNHLSPLAHPIMQRRNFEAHQARVRMQDQQRLLEALELKSK